MLGKLAGAGAALAAVGLFARLIGGGAGYSRVVDRPQAEVMAALRDLDITDAPGAPGTDPSRSGGIRPDIRLGETPDRMTWTVMSGDRIATQMTALFEPVDGGGTRVTAVVERGDAPDDFTSPAFRSEGITLGLFGIMLEEELNDLTLPPARDPEECRQMMEDALDSGALGSPHDPPGDLRAAMAQTARTGMRLSAMEAELRRAGCRTRTDFNDFKPVSQAMKPAPEDSPSMPRPGGPPIIPGKPMNDLESPQR